MTTQTINPIEFHLQSLQTTAAFENPSLKNMFRRWEREYSVLRLRIERKEKILAAIEEGYDTVNEVAAHTRISKSTVRREIYKLLRQKLITSTEVKIRFKTEVRYELVSPF